MGPVGRLEGASVLIAGSATPNSDVGTIKVAHDVVRALVPSLLTAGAGVVVLASAEPNTGDPPVPLVFDWTVLREIDVHLARTPGSIRPASVTIVTSEKARTGKMSADQRALLARLASSGVATIIQVPDETYTGGNIVDRQLAAANAMIAIGGTKGVVDRALKVAEQGGPVLPLDIDLGHGPQEGALRLRRMVLENPKRFFPGLQERAVSLLATTSLLAAIGSQAGASATASHAVTPNQPPTAARVDRGAGDPMIELRRATVALEASLRRRVPDWSPEAEMIKARVDSILSGLIDYEQIGRRAMGADWDGLTADQRRRFLETFAALAKQAFVSALDRPDLHMRFDSETVVGPVARVVVTAWCRSALRVPRSESITVSPGEDVAGWSPTWSSTRSASSTATTGNSPD